MSLPIFHMRSTPPLNIFHNCPFALGGPVDENDVRVDLKAHKWKHRIPSLSEKHVKKTFFLQEWHLIAEKILNEIKSHD